MASKALLSFLLTLFFSSYLDVALCQNNLDQLLPNISSGGQNNFLQDAKCMQNLIPCQEYVKNPNNPPPATCCAPLKEIHDGLTQTNCLCNFLNNPKLLDSFHTNKETMLNLPHACAIELDLSKCSTNTSSPAAEGESSVPEEDTSEAKESASSTKMITSYCVPALVALWTALAFSTY